MRQFSRMNPGFDYFWTTVGNTVYVPTAHDDDLDWGDPAWRARYEATLEHERVHTEQFAKLGVPLLLLIFIGPAPLILLAGLGLLVFGMWTQALITIGISVLTFPLTYGLAYGRWRIEREAYQVSRRYGVNDDLIVESLWFHYMHCWPRTWMKRWFDRNPVL